MKKLLLISAAVAVLLLNFNCINAQVSNSGMSGTMLASSSSFSNFATPSSAAIAGSTSTDANGNIKEYGLKFGLNWNNPIFSDSKFSSSSKLGYEIGLYTRRGAFFYWETGIYYFHLKSSEHIADSAQGSDLIYSNITVPLMVGLRLLGEQKALNLQVFGGANVAYLVSGKFDLLNLTTSNFEHFQFEPTIGAGVDVLILTVRLSYSYGVTNVLKDYNSHSSYIALYIGFHL